MTSSLFFISKAIKEGPLKKKSPHKLGQTKWSNRYVVLYEDALVYYQSKDAPKPRGVVPLQYVITATAILDTEPPKPGKSEVALNSRFEVAIRCTPSMKVFHWAATSEQDALSWVQEIKKISELVKAAQARDPYEAFCGPPSPRFWKDVVGLGVARARAAKEKAKADEKSPAPTPLVAGVGSPRVPRSASAPHSGTPPARDSVSTTEESKVSHLRNSSGEILYSPVGGVLKLGPLSPVPQAPVLVGVLSKRSPRGLKLWQRRYFSLFADLLIYSKSEGSPVLGAVPLECVESVSIIEITEGASLFNIVINHKGTANPKTLEIMASTPQECTMWVEALHYACPNTMYHKKQVAIGATPRSRNSSVAGMVRSGSQGVIEFDLSTPYVDKMGPESPSRSLSGKSVPPPPIATPEHSGAFHDLTLSGATSSDGKPPPKPPPRKLSTYGSFTNMHTTIPPTLYSALQEKKVPPSPSAASSAAASSPFSSTPSTHTHHTATSPSLIPRPSQTFNNHNNIINNNNKDPAPNRPPPPPPFRKSTSTAPTIIDDIFPSPFTPVAAPIFAPAKQKTTTTDTSGSASLPAKEEAPRVVAPVLTSAALPDPMEDAPPDYTSSSDDENSEASFRESVNFAAICTPESITTVTTYYRHKNTDSSDSEDYVLIDLDGAEDDGDRLEEKLPAFLPQVVPARKASSASWTAIHHNPAEYSPKLAVTKLSPDTVDRDLVLSVGPSRWRSISQKDGSPPPRRDSTPPTGGRVPSPTRFAKMENNVALAPSDYPTSILYHVNENKSRPSPSKIPPPPRLSEIHRNTLTLAAAAVTATAAATAASTATTTTTSPASSTSLSDSSSSSKHLSSINDNKSLPPTEILKPGEGQKGKEGISVGDYVELGGLSASKYNAQKGVVLFSESGRCEIRLVSGDVVRIKEVNLKKIPKPKASPQHRTSATNVELGLERRGSESGSGKGLIRHQSVPKLARTEAKAQAARLSKGPKLGDHKRALSQPPKANKVIPTTDADVPKPFLADEDGTGTDDDDDTDDDTDEQLVGIQSAPEWVKNRLYSGDVPEKSATTTTSSKSASDPRSKLSAAKEKLLKR